ncbi:hypothetical protein LguiA_007032 [Lonicera macranthoides]
MGNGEPCVGGYMLAYAATHCRGRHHAQQLRKGGELLTHVWLLMAHLGITEQFQISQGHAGAKLVKLQTFHGNNAAAAPLGVLMPLLKTTDGQSIGVCYGKHGDNLPKEQDVINLYNSNGIGKMRIYSPDPKILQALRGTNIELILDVPNDGLQSLASNPAVAAAWVQTNIQAFPDVKFKYISVGNEVDPNKDTSQYTGYVLLAMQNVHNAIVSAGLQDQIRVSTATYTGLLVNTSPPSQSAFNENVRSYIVPIIEFLVQHNLPLLVNVYPYFAYADDTQIPLEYALFIAPSAVVIDPDGNLQYHNLFDAMLDSHYAALEKAGGPNVGIVVSESGWPSEGGIGASVENAGMYYKNLIGHVKGVNGTPRKPNKAIETFLFAMFDENSKTGAETERHFGIFTPTRQPKYGITFN